MLDAPLFEVTIAAASAAARRLTTFAKAQAFMSEAECPSTDETVVTAIIDRVSAAASSYCKLARDAAGTVPTFGRETCRATWYVTDGDRGPKLLLPWRQPVTSISSVVEDGVTLTAGTDYVLRPGGMLERLSDDAPVCWSTGKIVVVFVAGYVLTTADTTPPDLEAAVIEQVKFQYLGRDRDPGILSEAEPDVVQTSYGDSRSWVGESGLLKTVESALGAYRNWSVI